MRNRKDEERILDIVLFTMAALKNNGVNLYDFGKTEASEITNAYMDKEEVK